MPIGLGLWRIDGVPARLEPMHLADETRLEDLLDSDQGLEGLDLAIVGRQVATEWGKVIDLLGMNADGDLVVLELKRDKTPRDVVAQVLDYGSWIGTLSYSDVEQLCLKYRKKQLDQVVGERFGGGIEASLVNQRHHLYIVASSLDAATERIVGYLAGRGVDINVLFFRYYVDDGREYVARSWLIDPELQSSTNVAPTKPTVLPPWDGKSFYVNIGEGETRNWEDARKYGFVSAGGGPFWAKQMATLKPGHIVYPFLSGLGYVGAGRVRAEAVPIDEFLLGDPLATALLPTDLTAPKAFSRSHLPDSTEFLVRVEWLHAVPREEGLWKPGMLAVPLAVARLRQPFTLEQLRERFPIPELEEGAPSHQR